MMNSYVRWKGIHTTTKVCGKVEEPVNAQIKYSMLHLIPLLLVLSVNTFHNFWTVLMALAPHDTPPTTQPPKLNTNSAPDIYLHNPKNHTIFSYSQQWLVPNETQPGLTSKNWCGMKETYLPGTIPRDTPHKSWGVQEGVGDGR